MARERRQLLFVAVATLIPFVLLAAWARFSGAAPAAELELLMALAATAGPLGTLSTALNFVGNPLPWILVLAPVAIVARDRRGTWAALLVAASYLSDVVAYVVKLIVERARPDTAAVEQLFGSDDFAFPSGHTARAAALVAVVVWLFAPRSSRVAVALAGGLIAGALMAWARVSLGVHWPSDTLGGILLGLGWFAVTTALVGASLARQRPS